LQETTFLPAFLLQQGFPAENAREMLIAIITQNIIRLIIIPSFLQLRLLTIK
jgi:hypothetical protein